MKRKAFQIKGRNNRAHIVDIEKKLSALKGVEEVSADDTSEILLVSYDEDHVTLDELAQVIENTGHVSIVNTGSSGAKIIYLLAVGLILFLFFVLHRQTDLFHLFGRLSPVSLLEGSGVSYAMLLLVGFLTAFHHLPTCGSVIMTQCLSKQDDTKYPALKPSLLFNIGRLLSYTIVGALMGALGSVVIFSPQTSSILQLVIGVLIMITGLNLLDAFHWLRPLKACPGKGFMNKIRHHQKGKRPFYVGLLTALLPCGLPAMQLIALSTQSPLSGATAMFFFSLGSTPLLFAVGVLSTSLSQKFTDKMMAVGALIVIFLGAMMFYRGWALSGFQTRSGITPEIRSTFDGDYQFVQTTLERDNPPYLIVYAHTPVKWLIHAEAEEIVTCNNPVDLPGLNIHHYLEAGENIIMFTPERMGTFTYRCGMGNLQGTVSVRE